MKKHLLYLTTFFISSVCFAQSSIQAKWNVTKVEITDVMVAENGEAKVTEEFLASLPEKDRAFTQGLLEGMGKAMLSSQMSFLPNDVYEEVNQKNKKTTKGTYKYNEKKAEISVKTPGSTDKFKVSSVDATSLVLAKEDPNVGEMIIHLKK